MKLPAKAQVNFFTADVAFVLKQKRLKKQWIEQIITSYTHQLKQVDFIFCSDSYLLNINQQFLNHNTFTDIITFDYCEKQKDSKTYLIAGEIYISIERVKENAIGFSTSFENELNRVLSHGILHLCGLKDKKPEEKILMRNKEDEALQMLRKLAEK